MQDQIVFKSQLSAISVKNLSIIFNEGTESEFLLLDKFSHDFERGKIHFIVGNSGSGKTTLVSHFNGLIKSRHGDIAVGDILIEGASRKIKNVKRLRKMCGMVFQFPEYQLFKDTIEKDVIFGPINLGEKKIDAKKKASHYLKAVGLDDTFLQRSPFDLSGGQKRRVAIAGILAIEPDILIFDEPTAGLDPAGEAEMMRIITHLHNQGKTIIIITHFMDQVLSLGDNVIILNDRKILATGAPYEIFTNRRLMSTTTLDLPKVIDVINNLIEIDPRFSNLLQMKPKNVIELANGINLILSEKHD